MAYRLDSTGDLEVLAATQANPPAISVISSEEYARFCTYLEKHSGIVLGENKEYLILSRLRSVLENYQIHSFAALLQSLEMGESRDLKKRVLDAMTTNETLWFRDSHPFEILTQRILPELEQKGKNHLRIWSAASSTGQEAYSISITIQEYLSKNSGKFPSSYEIVATDLCARAVQQARQAQYEHHEILRGLSSHYRQKYFEHDGDVSIVKPEIRQHVRFQELNLIQNYALMGEFDVIFLRNVLIYFSNERKTDILNRMAQALRPGGYLFLGGSEPIANYSDQFEMIRCPQGVVYQLNPDEANS